MKAIITGHTSGGMAKKKLSINDVTKKLLWVIDQPDDILIQVISFRKN